MSNLGITHVVTVDPDLPRNDWPWQTDYWVQLSWGEVFGGTGYEGLLSALRALRRELELALSEEADDEAREGIRSRIDELKAFTDGYLNDVKSLAAEAEAKAALGLKAYLESLDLKERQVSETFTGTIEIRFQDRNDVAATLDVCGEQQEEDSLDDLLSTMLPGAPQI